MGFDVCGNVADEKSVGHYFRNNCWWWRPLAEYVLEVCEDVIPSVQAKYWQSNDGQAVSKETALAIADRLDSLLASGAVARYEAQYKKEMDSIPDVECDLCGGTGKRTDMVVENGCNGCKGTGKKQPFETFYPFSEENVKDFSQFCRASQGFAIY